MRNPQYLILYRDSKRAKAHIFGPFVTQTIADKFKEDLPEPLEGGYKLRRYTEPQTYNEAKSVALSLVKERQRELA